MVGFVTYVNFVGVIAFLAHQNSVTPGRGSVWLEHSPRTGESVGSNPTVQTDRLYLCPTKTERCSLLHSGVTTTNKSKPTKIAMLNVDKNSGRS